MFQYAFLTAEQELEYTESSNRHEIQQYKENVIKLESAVEEAQIATTKIEVCIFDPPEFCDQFLLNCLIKVGKISNRHLDSF